MLNIFLILLTLTAIAVFSIQPADGSTQNAPTLPYNQNKSSNKQSRSLAVTMVKPDLKSKVTNPAKNTETLYTGTF